MSDLLFLVLCVLSGLMAYLMGLQMLEHRSSSFLVGFTLVSIIGLVGLVIVAASPTTTSVDSARLAVIAIIFLFGFDVSAITIVNERRAGKS